MKTSLVNTEETGWGSDRHRPLVRRTSPSNSCLCLSVSFPFLSPLLPFSPLSYRHTEAHFKASKRRVPCIRTRSRMEKKGSLSDSKSGVPNSERRREGAGVGWIWGNRSHLPTDPFIILLVFVYDSYSSRGRTLPIIK